MKFFFASNIFGQDFFSLTRRIVNKLNIYYAQLLMKKYKKVVSNSVEVDGNNEELRIFLPDDIFTQIKEVEFYDFQGFLGKDFLVRNYKFSGNYLVINFSEIPVAGQMAVLISTDQGKFIIKYCNEKLEFGQWKILSGFFHNLIVTPKSNGLVRPVRRQILIKKFAIGANLAIDIPLLKIDDVAILSKDSNTLSKINYKIKKGTLFINTDTLPLVDGQLFEILIISEGNHYRIFQPSGMLLDESKRYQRINDSMKYIYISEDGYLYFYCLNEEQKYRLSSTQRWEADAISINGGEIRILFNNIPFILSEDTIIARRYKKIMPFAYRIDQNELILSPKDANFKMLGDFPYTLEVKHDNKNNVGYTPIRLRQSKKEDADGESLFSKIYLTNSPIEIINWEALPVVGVVQDNLVFIKSNDLDATIKKVLAEYKERPVYTNITNGISDKKLRNVYKKIRVVYWKRGNLLINDVSVSSIVDHLVR